MSAPHDDLQPTDPQIPAANQSPYLSSFPSSTPDGEQPPYIPPPMPPATLGTAAPAPRRSNTPLVLILISGFVVVLLLIAGVAFARTRGGLFGASTTPVTAASILDQAGKVNLQDAKFTINGQLGLGLGTSASSSSLDINGTGTFTAKPARTQVALTIPLLGQQNTITAFADESTIYVQAPAVLAILGIPTTDSNKWVKIPLDSTNSSPKMSMSLADLYRQIQNPQLAGSDTLNGTPVWHITGTLDIQEKGTPTAKATATATPTPKDGTPAFTMTPTAVDLWLTKDHFYPYKFSVQTAVTISGVDFAGLLGGLPGLPGTGTTTPTATTTPGTSTAMITTTLSATFSDWNKGATLTPPTDILTIPGIPGIPGSATPTPTANS